MKPRILVMGQVSDPVLRAGGETIRVGNRDLLDAAEAITEVDGVLLCGGGDVDPMLYSRKAHRQAYGVSEERDQAELWVIQAANELRLPILGICRGSQILTVAAGGKLEQHVPDRVRHEGHRSGRHRVVSEAGTILRRAFRATDSDVVSLHHQAVSKPGRGFVVSGRAPDGTVEAVESRDGRVLGVQFHPEINDEHPASRRIFSWLVREAAARSGLPTPRVVKPARSKPRIARPRPDLSLSWRCFRCDIDFDEREDHLDHMWVLHQVDLQAERG